MAALLSIARLIDRINLYIGEAVSWLTVAMVLVTVVIVVLRYGFSIGFIWMQESVRFMYAIVFMLCAGYTLLHNGHVRVDVFYLKFSKRRQVLVDIFGSLFLLIPVCSTILFYSWDYVLNSWAEFEGSMEVRGLHAVFLLKTCIWVFGYLMIAQAISTIIHGISFLVGLEAPHKDEHSEAL